MECTPRPTPTLLCAEDGTNVQFEAGKMKALEVVAAINKKARTM